MNPSLLGSGTYGCVYRPPLCSTPSMEEDHTYVGKVAVPSQVNTELEVADRLRESSIDWEIYFGILTGDSCPVEVTDSIRSACPPVKGVKAGQEIRSFPSEYLGVPLNRYDGPITMQWLWHSFTHLLVGIDLLHSIDIYHMDIKPPNIVVDDTETCRLIDFGIAFIHPTAKRLARRNDVYYSINPLFYNAYNTRYKFGGGLDFSLMSNLELRKTYHRNYQYLAKFYYPNYEEGMITDFIDTSLFLGSRGKYDEQIVIPNIEKVDLYQLADTFNDVYITQEKKGTFDLDSTRSLYEPHWGAVINGCLHLDVNQQWTVKKTLEYVRSTGRTIGSVP